MTRNVAQVTDTLLTFAAAITPDSFASAQVWLAGCVAIVTAYALPAATAVVNVKAPSASRVRSLPALFRSTRPPPLSPVTVPPTVKVFVTQVTAMAETLAAATVPVPLVTAQVWFAG